jgi:hypothetical protein
MSNYDGEWYGYISGIQHNNSFNFTTASHYPGDPNFSGSFTAWLTAIGDAKRQATIAFTEKFHVVVTIQNDNITKVQKVIDI